MRYVAITNANHYHFRFSKRVLFMKPLKVIPLVASAVLLSPVYAQMDSTTDRDVASAAIEEIVVSAQYLYSDTVNALKTPTPILNVPQSLSIVSAKDIRARGFNSIS